MALAGAHEHLAMVARFRDRPPFEATHRLFKVKSNSDGHVVAKDGNVHSSLCLFAGHSLEEETEDVGMADGDFRLPPE